ncbi:hypothetical protein KKB40_01665 [Patescibacteria group bacterium]|nr:hypothetical protein [Patescibacteria group bacterium]
MEIFKRFNADGIAKLTTESKADDNLVKWFNSQENKFDLNEENTPIITITEFDEERLPTTDEIGFLIETLYPHSHIVTIPIIPSINKMKKSENFDSYKTYLNSCIKTIEDLNHKPIMGTVPKLPRNQLNELIEFYADQGINSFLLDLNGSSPMAFGTHSFRFLSALKRNKLLDNSFILAHNVGIRVNKKEDNIPAKDILGFGLGYNALGNKQSF